MVNDELQRIVQPYLRTKLEGRVERDQNVGAKSLSMPEESLRVWTREAAYSHIGDRASEYREFVVGIISL